MRLGPIAGCFAVTIVGLGTCAFAQRATPADADRDRPPAPTTQPTPRRGERGGPFGGGFGGGFGRNGFGGGGGFGFMWPGAIRAEKHTWLGIAVSPATPVVAHQLKLPEGVGLVVDEVMPAGPAAKAGLKQYDVLRKLDDQLLVNPEQLETLVRMHKSGDQVTLNVFHDGESTDLKLTLQEGGPPRMMPFGGPRVMPPRAPRDGMAPPVAPRPPMPPRPPSDRGGRFDQLFHRLHLPDITARIENGDVIVTDESGHVLFKHPLELDIDGMRFPHDIRLHVGPERAGDRSHEEGSNANHPGDASAEPPPPAE